jgi:8-oxo-dGTP pyrophosphatase MutT (NUDIX family)
MEKLSNHIRVKSLAWIEHEGLTFVVTMPDSVKQDYYFRPIGGSVEFGETSLEAVKREWMEEMQAEINVSGEPLILENFFTCDGKFGHEIDYIYPASFLDIRFYENKSYRLVEADGSEFKALWVSIADCLSGKLRLVPEPLLQWIQKKK